MLRVVQANRLELLARALLTQLPLGDPLAPITIVVPSRGTGQWLGQELARTLGIVANLDLVLPSTFAWRVYRAFDPALPESSEFDLTNLRWRVLRLLETQLDAPQFAELAAYVRADLAGSAEAGDRRRYQLAARIADVFDQYLVYRRDWIARFETADEAELHAGPLFADPLFRDAAWQPPLWRALVGDIGHRRHRATLLGDTLVRLHGDGPDAAPLAGTMPTSVAVFGLSSAPPDLLQLLCALARHIDVQLYVPNPCREYWADIIGERALARLSLRAQSAGQEANAGPSDRTPGAGIDPTRYYEAGNPLLASLGGLNRDFVDLVNAAVDAMGPLAERHEFFAAPDAATLLSHIQADILSLRVRGSTGPLAPDALRDPIARVAVAATDASLAIHVCHGALREVEVLHDQLLHRFSADPSLTPRDVVVMIPDIATYAPYIAAVFGDAPYARRIPYAVADRGARDESTIVEGLFALFDLVGSRWGVAEVVGLLDIAAVQRRFGVQSQGLAQIRFWLEQVRVRWGRDRAHWDARDLPVSDATSEQANTWAFGLERLLLGYALPPDAAPFAGVLPAANVDGQAVGVLTALLAYIGQLDAATRALREPASPTVWRARLEAMLAALFAVDTDDAAEVRGLSAIHHALAALQTQTAAAEYSGALPLAIVREYLRERLLSIDETPAFLSGRVTFCTLVPMRAIPFRLVCLLGMNDADFPRRSTPLGFDLLAHSAGRDDARGRTRRGDRSRAAEDRQMFLDALLSARDALYVSYVGRSDRDEAPRNPSVLVSALLDYVDAHYRPAGDDAGAIVAALTTRHRLQPFAARYFAAGDDDAAPAMGGWFSYDERWLPSLRAVPGVAQSPAQTERVAGTPDPVPRTGRGEPGAAVVAVADLRAFVRHPSRWLLQQRFGVRFPDSATTVEEDEPFALEGLDRYRLKVDALVAAQHQQLPQWRERAPLTGALPQGQAGAALADIEMSNAAQLVAQVSRRGFGALTSMPVNCQLGGVAIIGHLDGMTDQGWRGLRVGTLKDRDRAELWLAHLLLTVSDIGLPCVFIDEVAMWSIRSAAAASTSTSMDRARAVLTRLVGLMTEFTNDSPRLLVGTSQKFAAASDADKALKVWCGGDGNYGAEGERDDPYVQALCGAGDEPSGEWRSIATEIYAGMAIVRSNHATASGP